MNGFRLMLGLGVAALLVQPSEAHTPRIAAIQQQPIPGVGTTVWIDEIDLGDGGVWMAEVDTDVAQGKVVLRSGQIALREGDAVAPAPASIARFQSLSMARNGELAAINILGGTSSYNDDGGVYGGGTGLLLQEGAPVVGGSWTPGTFYVFFNDVIVNANRQALVRGYVDDPLVGDNLDYFMSIVTYDASGSLVNQTFVVHEFDFLPGMIAPVAAIELGPDEAGFNSSGQALFTAYLDTGAQTVGDSTIWLWDGTTHTLLAREGDPSPVAGRLWGSLYQPRLSLNDAGDWAAITRLDGDQASDEILVRNGAKVAQEGDRLPSLGGHRLRGFGGCGARLDDAGNVLWWGRWDDPDQTRNRGLFLNDELLIQTGRVRVDGMLLAEIDDQPGALAISPDGRWVMFRGTFLNGRRAALLIDREEPLRRFCFGQDYVSPCPCGTSAPDAGCDNSFGTGGARLSVGGEPSLANDSLFFFVDGLPPDTLVVFLEDSVPPPTDAGLLFGDGTLCSGGGFSFLAARYAEGGVSGLGASGGPAISTLGFVGGPGDVRYYQAIYRNQRPFCTSDGFNLSSGLRVIWQP